VYPGRLCLPSSPMLRSQLMPAVGSPAANPSGSQPSCFPPSLAVAVERPGEMSASRPEIRSGSFPPSLAVAVERPRDRAPIVAPVADPVEFATLEEALTHLPLLDRRFGGPPSPSVLDLLGPEHSDIEEHMPPSAETVTPDLLLLDDYNLQVEVTPSQVAPIQDFWISIVRSHWTIIEPLDSQPRATVLDPNAPPEAIEWLRDNSYEPALNYDQVPNWSRQYHPRTEVTFLYGRERLLLCCFAAWRSSVGRV
jgi:hypothetical protein